MCIRNNNNPTLAELHNRQQAVAGMKHQRRLGGAQDAGRPVAPTLQRNDLRCKWREAVLDFDDLAMRANCAKARMDFQHWCTVFAKLADEIESQIEAVDYSAITRDISNSGF
jgi:hypothetical protein